jgi:hypothetical protein
LFAVRSRTSLRKERTAPAPDAPRRRSRCRLAVVGALPLLATLALGAVLLTTPATAGVHSAAASGGPVAVVGSAEISHAAFRHWLIVANDAGQASTGKAAPPLPLPPTYAACIAALQATPADAGDTAAQLRASCVKSYRALVKDVMNYLIQAIWVEGEANARGITVTRAQVKAEFQAQRKTTTPPLTTAAELDSFMAKSGQTLADLRWRTRLNLLATAITHEVEAKAGHVTAAQIAAYYAAHRAQFKGKTLAASSAQIRKLIALSRQAKAGAKLTHRFDTVWRGRTLCRTAFAVSSCSKVAAAIAPHAGAPYPGTIALPPARPQTRTFTPTS